MASSVQELLGHCLAQLQDNNRRVENLEAHLQEYGYRSEFVPPAEAEEATPPEVSLSNMHTKTHTPDSPYNLIWGVSSQEWHYDLALAFWPLCILPLNAL